MLKNVNTNVEQNQQLNGMQSQVAVVSEFSLMMTKISMADFIVHTPIMIRVRYKNDTQC